jgi:hypothetical protein
MYVLLPLRPEDDGDEAKRVVRAPDGLTTFNPNGTGQVQDRYAAWLAAGNTPVSEGE